MSHCHSNSLVTPEWVGPMLGPLQWATQHPSHVSSSPPKVFTCIYSILYKGRSSKTGCKFRSSVSRYHPIPSSGLDTRSFQSNDLRNALQTQLAKNCEEKKEPIGKGPGIQYTFFVVRSLYPMPLGRSFKFSLPHLEERIWVEGNRKWGCSY